MDIVFYSAKNFNIFLSLFQQISTVYWIKTEIENIKLSKYYTRQKILIMHVISLRKPSTPSKSKKLITRDVLLTSDFPKVKKYGSPSICDRIIFHHQSLQKSWKQSYSTRYFKHSNWQFNINTAANTHTHTHIYGQE